MSPCWSVSRSPWVVGNQNPAAKIKNVLGDVTSAHSLPYPTPHPVRKELKSEEPHNNQHSMLTGLYACVCVMSDPIFNCIAGFHILQDRE